jgi:hypothetical protein
METPLSLSSTLPMGAPEHPKGEGEPEVLLSRCSGKSLRDLSRIASGEKTLSYPNKVKNTSEDEIDIQPIIHEPIDAGVRDIESNTTTIVVKSGCKEYVYSFFYFLDILAYIFFFFFFFFVNV